MCSRSFRTEMRRKPGCARGLCCAGRSYMPADRRESCCQRYTGTGKCCAVCSPSISVTRCGQSGVSRGFTRRWTLKLAGACLGSLRAATYILPWLLRPWWRQAGQILLSQLVVDIRGAAAEASIAAGDDLVELRALTAALKHLVGLGVLEEIEGTVADLGHGGSGEALITVDTELLGLVMARTRAGESLEAGPHAQEPAVVGLPPGMGARRRMVEDPVVLYADLPAAEAEFLRRYQRREGYWLDRYFGLQVEARAEGVAVIDPEEYLTDLSFPAGSTVARMALLMLEPLLAQSAPREADGGYPVSIGQIRHACGDLAGRYPSAWAKGDLANLDALASKVADMLFQTGLARHVSGDDAVLVPAACRWKPRIEERKAVTESIPGSADDELTLFGDEDAVS